MNRHSSINLFISNPKVVVSVSVIGGVGIDAVITVNANNIKITSHGKDWELLKNIMVIDISHISKTYQWYWCCEGVNVGINNKGQVESHS